MHKKILCGIAGATVASVVAWKTLFPWIGEDIELLKTGSIFVRVMKGALMSGQAFIDVFEEQVKKNGKKTFIIFEDNIYSYEFVNEQANRVANIVKTWGIKVGETVAILIHNEPAFIWTSLGLQKLGIVSADINYNLRSQQLSHCMKTSEAKAVIVGAGEDLLHAVEDVRDELGGIPIYVQGVSSNDLPSEFISFDDLMLRSLPVQLDRSIRSGVNALSAARFIYTSGTTGLPKPAIITQIKMHGMSTIMHLVGIKENDVVYVLLPLYHTAGGGIALHGAISVGCTIVLRRKFSASHFWEDCRKYHVTLIQYVGELCRYLLAQPKNALDGRHSVRAAIGNGLRKDIWTEFRTRFKIPLFCEFYGATEGTALTFSLSNTPGVIGRMSPFMQWIRPAEFKQALVKYDYATAEPIRDKQGRCIEIKPGESGLFVSSISKMLLGAGVKFYKASDEANEKMIIHDAFQKGDAFFNSGDLLYLDKNYNLYFADRIGDTFRWKGENVSTTEVANVLTKATFIQDANVYGVHIADRDGQAGMASITLNENETISADKLLELVKICEANLTSYARPMFLRIQKEVSITATFKQMKLQLVKEGFDPSKVEDPLYYLDPQLHQYVPITTHLYSQLLTKLRL